MSKCTWTTIWSRSQRGMNLFPHAEKEQTVTITLPPCSKLRFRFANAYDTGKVSISQVSLCMNKASFPLFFEQKDRLRLAKQTSACCDEIACEVEHEVIATLVYQVEGESVNSGCTLASYDSVSTKNGRLYALQAIEVYSDAYQGCVAVFGDSIVEQGNWTSNLEDAFAKCGYTLLNAGISGNRLLRNLSHVQLDRESAQHIGMDHAICLDEIPLGMQVFGIAGKDRFLRDVLEASNLQLVILSIGINDLFQPDSFCAKVEELPTLSELVNAYEDLCECCNSKGIKVIACTLTPFQGCHNFTKEKEQLRKEFNQYICETQRFIVNFEPLLVDEQGALKAEFYDGDALHPNRKGGEAMSALFLSCWEGFEC